MILGMGASELVVILLVALVIFGPKNLPKLGASMGKTVKNFREGMEGDDELKPKPAEAHVSEASADNVEDADA